MPHRFIRHNGPSTLVVSLLEQPEKKRYTIHLLSYIPVRKTSTIDIIEERTRLTDITLKLELPKPIQRAVLLPAKQELPIKDKTLKDKTLKDKILHIPLIDGYAIIELCFDSNHK